MSACPTFSQESSLTLTVLYTTLIPSLNLYFISSPSQLLPKSFTKADYVWVPAKSLQLCLTLCDPTDCSLPGSSLHRILQAGILEWVAILLQGSNLHLLQLLHCRQILYHWATGEAQTMHDSISNYYLLIHMHFFFIIIWILCGVSLVGRVSRNHARPQLSGGLSSPLVKPPFGLLLVKLGSLCSWDHKNVNFLKFLPQ